MNRPWAEAAPGSAAALLANERRLKTDPLRIGGHQAANALPSTAINQRKAPDPPPTPH